MPRPLQHAIWTYTSYLALRNTGLKLIQVAELFGYASRYAFYPALRRKRLHWEQIQKAKYSFAKTQKHTRAVNSTAPSSASARRRRVDADSP